VVSACGVDLGFLLLEMAQLVTVREPTLRTVARWANPAIADTPAGSAVLMGCFLPAFIYVLTRVSAHFANH
jgi:hypothetical protein